MRWNIYIFSLYCLHLSKCHKGWGNHHLCFIVLFHAIPPFLESEVYFELFNLTFDNFLILWLTVTDPPTLIVCVVCNSLTALPKIVRLQIWIPIKGESSGNFFVAGGTHIKISCWCFIDENYYWANLNQIPVRKKQALPLISVWGVLLGCSGDDHGGFRKKQHSVPVAEG